MTITSISLPDILQFQPREEKPDNDNRGLGVSPDGREPPEHLCWRLFLFSVESEQVRDVSTPGCDVTEAQRLMVGRHGYIHRGYLPSLVDLHPAIDSSLITSTFIIVTDWSGRR